MEVQLREIATNVFVNALSTRKDAYTEEWVGNFVKATEEQFHEDFLDRRPSKLPHRQIRVLGHSEEECEALLADFDASNADLQSIDYFETPF